MLTVIINAIRFNQYEIYSRPFEMNIVGIRANSIIPNRFDDQIHVFFKNATNKWVHYIFKATTDPGTYWLQNPLNEQGTAVLRQGQYKGAYAIGLHRSKYYALIQQQPVNVLRDYDRNAVLDFKNGKPETGLFGINIHRANEEGNTKTVDKNSAGCQVFANAKDFNLFMQLCDRHRQLYGNKFTYTLIDQRAIVRERRKTLAGIGLGIGAALITYKLIKP